MLEVLDAPLLEHLLATLPCKVEAPATMRSRFSVGEVLPAQPDDRRGCPRKTCFSKRLIELRQSLPLFPREECREVVLLLNISRTGIGFLHHQQLYPGEHIVLLGPAGALRYEVVRARKHNTTCFEIGARFVGKAEDV